MHKLGTYLAWFGILTYRGLIWCGQLRRVVIYIQNPNTHYRVGCHGVVFCGEDSREHVSVICLNTKLLVQRALIYMSIHRLSERDLFKNSLQNLLV